MKKATRVEQLEEEVKLYRDAAHSTAMESQSISISASEAIERSEKSTHEKQLILRDLKHVETELQTKNIMVNFSLVVLFLISFIIVIVQLTRIQDELNLEKVKYKKMHVEKLAAERRASELIAAKSRAEV